MYFRATSIYMGKKGYFNINNQLIFYLLIIKDT